MHVCPPNVTSNALFNTNNDICMTSWSSSTNLNTSITTTGIYYLLKYKFTTVLLFYFVKRDLCDLCKFITLFFHFTYLDTLLDNYL